MDFLTLRATSAQLQHDIKMLHQTGVSRNVAWEYLQHHSLKCRATDQAAVFDDFGMRMGLLEETM